MAAFLRLALVALAVLVVGGVVHRGYIAITERRAERMEARAEVLASTRGKVVVYTAHWCPACRTARDWLVAEKIPFEERDIELPTGAKEKRAIGRGGIPQFVVDEEVLQPGFSATMVNRARAAHGMR